LLYSWDNSTIDIGICVVVVVVVVHFGEIVGIFVEPVS